MEQNKELELIDELNRQVKSLKDCFESSIDRLNQEMKYFNQRIVRLESSMYRLGRKIDDVYFELKRHKALTNLEFKKLHAKLDDMEKRAEENKKRAEENGRLLNYIVKQCKKDDEIRFFEGISISYGAGERRLIFPPIESLNELKTKW